MSSVSQSRISCTLWIMGITSTSSSEKSQLNTTTWEKYDSHHTEHNNNMNEDVYHGKVVISDENTVVLTIDVP